MNKQQEAYYKSLMKHIKYVQEAGKKIGVCPIQLAVHDQSKFTDIEFIPYAETFFDEDGNKQEFNGDWRSTAYIQAWLHHIHHNPHHWQHWIFGDGWNVHNVENGIAFMPDHYALEMIADWMGASKAYTGDWDMTDWLLVNVPKIKVHSGTAQFLRSKLADMGYGEVMDKVMFDGIYDGSWFN